MTRCEQTSQRTRKRAAGQIPGAVRPITLTSAAVVLAMIPLLRSSFFDPMTTALMGGITVATVLTLLCLPVLYAVWFRVQRPA